MKQNLPQRSPATLSLSAVFIALFLSQFSFFRFKKNCGGKFRRLSGIFTFKRSLWR
jgi:hypothetical protein